MFFFYLLFLKVFYLYPSFGHLFSFHYLNHFHKDNLRHLPRFPDFFVTFRILSSWSCVVFPTFLYLIISVPFPFNSFISWSAVSYSSFSWWSPSLDSEECQSIGSLLLFCQNLLLVMRIILFFDEIFMEIMLSFIIWIVRASSYISFIFFSWLLVFVLYVFFMILSGFNLYCWKGIHFS